jgi:UDP-N-acetylmuramoyl-L-alanyl-D-glutamate--2,6-diaminopimelate ligase
VRAVCKGKIICVFGCGGDRDSAKRAPMGEAVALGADYAILTNDNPRSEDPETIAADVVKGLERAAMTLDGATKRYAKELDRKRAIELAVKSARPGDAVVISGKGHETYQIVGSEKRSFDDRIEARAALAMRRGAST